MIKRCVSLLIIMNISFVYAILGGVGINVIQDGFTLDGETFDGPEGIASVTRTDVGSPVGIGAFVYLTIIPFVDFEASANFTASSYNYEYQDALGGNEEVPLGFGKFTWNLSAQKPIFKIPTIRIYAGAGLNGASYTKIVTYETMKNLDPDQLNDMVYVKEELGVSTQGFHLELGGRFKPPIIPFSINVNARYNFIQDLVPGEDGFLSLSAGFAFAI